MLRFVFALCTLVTLVQCTESVPTGGAPARVLAMGDSMLAWNSASGRSVAHVLERRLGGPVVDRSVPGARMLYALPISGSLGFKIGAQFVDQPWDWVVMNGGGNDLLFGCGCGRCTGVLNRLVSADGRSGAIPQAVAAARASGAQVVYSGYLRSPGVPSSIDQCRRAGDALEARLITMADLDPGVHFVTLKDLVPEGDRSFHTADIVHPSPKGSAAIAERLADVILAPPG